MNRFEVTYTGPNWEVVRNGIAVSRQPKKSRAVAVARRLAGQAGGTLVIRRQDGTEQETETFGLSKTGAGPG